MNLAQIMGDLYRAIRSGDKTLIGFLRVDRRLGGESHWDNGYADANRMINQFWPLLDAKTKFTQAEVETFQEFMPDLFVVDFWDIQVFLFDSHAIIRYQVDLEPAYNCTREVLK